MPLHPPLGRLRRTLAATFVALALCMGAVTVVPSSDTVAAASEPFWPYDPDIYDWDDKDDIQKWWAYSSMLVFAFSDMQGAWLKDVADGRKFDLLRFKVGPDWMKYTVRGGVMAALVIAFVLYEILDDSPSFQSLLGERVGGVSERLAYLDHSLVGLELATTQVLNRIQDVDYRLRHEQAENTFGDVDFYRDELDVVFEDLEDLTGPSGNVSDTFMDMWATGVLGSVEESLTAVELLLFPPGTDSLLTSFAEARYIDYGINVDDREFYRDVFDQAAYWTTRLGGAYELLLEAFSIRLMDPANEQYYEMYLSRIDEMLENQRSIAEAIWSRVGHPISDDHVITINEWLFQRTLDQPATGIQAEAYEWPDTITEDEFDELRTLAATWGGGGTFRAQMDNLGVEIPPIVKIDKPSGNTTLTFQFEGIEDSHVFDESYSCEYYGFTQPFTAQTGAEWKRNYAVTMDGGHTGSGTYDVGVHCVPTFHRDGNLHNKGKTGEVWIKDGGPLVTGERAFTAVNLDQQAVEDQMRTPAGHHMLPTTAFSLAGPAEYTVFVDGQAGTTYDEPVLYAPGLVDEVTLTVDPDNVPTDGHAILATGLDGPVEFHGLHHGTDTVTLDVLEGGHYQVFTKPTELPSSRNLGLTVEGDGSVVAVLDGVVVDIAEEGVTEVPIRDDITEITLASDVDRAGQSGLVLIPEQSAGPFAGWDGEYVESGSFVVPLPDDDDVELTPTFADDAAPTVDLTITGPGFVDIFNDGAPVTTRYASGEFGVPAEQLIITSDIADVDLGGWVAVARADDEGYPGQWSGVADPYGPEIVELGDGLAIGVDFAHPPVPATIDLGFSGVDDNSAFVDVYVDGELDTRVTGNDRYTPPTYHRFAVLTGNEAEIADDGLTLVPGANSKWAFAQWSGAHNGAHTETLLLGPGRVVDVTAEFESSGIAVHSLNHTDTVVGDQSIHYGAGTVTLDGGHISTNGSTTGYWSGGKWAGASFNAATFSFDVHPDGTLINATASGDLHETTMPTHCSPTDPRCHATSTRYPITGATGQYDPATNRLTVHFESNNGPDNTVIFDLI